MDNTLCMNDSAIVKALGKIIVAAAWVDGEVQPEEQECLKDLLFQLPEIPESDLRELEAMTQDPIGETEREVFLQEFLEMIRHQKDKDFAIYALDRVIHADGVVTEMEETIIRQMQEAIEAVATRNMSLVEDLLRVPLSRRNQATRVPKSRSGSGVVDRFVAKQVKAFKAGRRQLGLEEEQLKKLALGGYLMARVVRADNRIRETEVALLREFIAKRWELDEEAAAFVTRICLTQEGTEVDLIRACRVFYDLTGEDERVEFLDILFRVAMVDDELTDDEIQEVINISANLKLEHNYFHEAFTKSLDRSASE